MLRPTFHFGQLFLLGRKPEVLERDDGEFLSRPRHPGRASLPYRRCVDGGRVEWMLFCQEIYRIQRGVHICQGYLGNGQAILPRRYFHPTEHTMNGEDPGQYKLLQFFGVRLDPTQGNLAVGEHMCRFDLPPRCLYDR